MASVTLSSATIPDLTASSPAQNPRVTSIDALRRLVIFSMIFDLLHLDTWYFHLAQPGLAHAVARSIGCAVVILSLSAALNHLGLRLKL